jgi:hypothetical protein
MKIIYRVKMKRFFWLLTVFLIVSCSNDDKSENLHQSYGVVKEDVSTNASGKLYIRSDNGKIIVPTLSNPLSNDYKDSRVWILFSTNNDIQSDTVKANLYDLLKITNMEFKNRDDESKSDIVYLQDIWIAQDYLTLIMDVAAGSENSLRNHKYTVYSDLEVINDTVRMEFKYDRNNDALNTRFSKIVTLKLDDKIDLTQNAGSVVLSIKYLSGTGSYNKKYITYKK